MEAQPDVALARQGARVEEGLSDPARAVEMVERVAADGMGAEWEELAVDAERADAERPPVPYLSGQGRRFVRGDRRQVITPRRRRERRHVVVGSRSVLDRGVEKLTAETPADHRRRTIQSPST
jgi:hypothetical protein